MSINFNSFLLFAIGLTIVIAEPWSGLIPQEHFQYKYNDYWSKDTDSCIVADATLSGTSTTFDGVASIQYCDGNYAINNRTLVLPRNTMSICGYIPVWYDLTAKTYKGFIYEGFKQGNSTLENYKQECLEVLKVSSKSRFETMYDTNVHEIVCIRYAEFLTLVYGLDPKIVNLVEEIENQISPSLKWKNSKQQAYNFISSICFGINKGSCIDLVRHILDEGDNSVLNLLGLNNYQTPTTWLYADGIDIIILHNFIEIMGMTLETQKVDGINYYHISPEVSSGPFVWHSPGLLGGKPKSLVPFKQQRQATIKRFQFRKLISDLLY